MLLLRLLTYLLALTGVTTFGARALRQRWSGMGKKFLITTVTFNDNYATGGYPITKQQLGFGGSDTIDAVIPVGPASTGHWALWDNANNKLKFFSAAGTELVNASAALAGGATITLYAIGN